MQEEVPQLMKNTIAVFQREFRDSLEDAQWRFFGLCAYVVVGVVALGALLFFAPWQETRQWKVDILPGEYVWMDSLYTLDLPTTSSTLYDEEDNEAFLSLSQGKTKLVTIQGSLLQYGIIAEVNGKQVLLIYTAQGFAKHNIFYTPGPQDPVIENGSIVQTLYRDWTPTGVLWGAYVFAAFLFYWGLLGNKLKQRNRVFAARQ